MIGVRVKVEKRFKAVLLISIKWVFRSRVRYRLALLAWILIVPKKMKRKIGRFYSANYSYFVEEKFKRTVHKNTLDMIVKRYLDSDSYLYSLSKSDSRL